MGIAALDDLDDPGSGSCGGGANARPLITAVGEDSLDEGEQGAGSLVEDQRRAVAILDVGAVDGDAQQQAERIDENVPLAALDLLARVVA